MNRILDRLTLAQSTAIGLTIALVLASAVPVYLLLSASARPEDVRAWEISHPGDRLERLVVELDLARVRVSAVRGADLNVVRAWERTRGSGAVVAVVDAGIDISLPEFAGNVWTNPDEPCGSVDADHSQAEHE